MLPIHKPLTAITLGLGLIVGTAQAAPIFNFDFTGTFVMFDGGDPTFTNPSNVVNNGNGLAGDPVTGTILFNFATGAGVATMSAGEPFFGYNWYARDFTLQAIASDTVIADMLIDWGAPDASTTCGVLNCDMALHLVFDVMSTDMAHYQFTTIDSTISGPFSNLQPTFNLAVTLAPTQVPAPPSTWLFGVGAAAAMMARSRKRAFFSAHEHSGKQVHYC